MPSWDLLGNNLATTSDPFLGSKDAEPLTIKTRGNTRMVITEDGLVKVAEGGATVNDIAIGTKDTGIDYSKPFETIGISNLNANLRLQSPNGIFFHTGRGTTPGSVRPTERLSIAPDGNVSIGTQAERARLDVNGDVTIRGSLDVSGIGSAVTGDRRTGVEGRAEGNNGVTGAFFMGKSPNVGGGGGTLNPPNIGVVGAAMNDLQDGLARPAYGVYGWSHGGNPSYAGVFSGNVSVTGNLQSGSKQFVIDHPLDPENKTLSHSAVESPESTCLYRGKVILDADGKATVRLPDYFAALTKEDEATVYLTPIGEDPSPTSYKWEEAYTSLTVFGAARAEVGYLVLAARDDPSIHMLSRQVEEEKGEGTFERGKLLHPEAFGKPAEAGISILNATPVRAERPLPEPVAREAADEMGLRGLGPQGD